jgi:small subunit ribosomal protein S21
LIPLKKFEFNNKKIIQKRIMIIVPLKEGENIEKALKKFKRKYEKTGVVKELRRRQEFRKPSVVKREQRLHAVYVQAMHRSED